MCTGWMHEYLTDRPSLPMAGAHPSHADGVKRTWPTYPGGYDSFVRPFHHWVIWRGTGLIHVEQDAHFLEQLGRSE